MLHYICYKVTPLENHCSKAKVLLTLHSLVFKWVDWKTNHDEEFDEDLAKSQQKPKANIDIERDFFNLINNSVLEKTMKNIRKYKILNLWQITEEDVIYCWNLNIMWSEKLLQTEMNKTEADMRKLVFLGLSVLDIRKITMCEY